MVSAFRAIVQARTTSSRLPGKAFLPLGGVPSALLCARRAANRGADVVVATSTDPTDDDLAALLVAGGVRVARGSLDDVLARVVDALDDVPDDLPVVRLTADNVVPDGAFLTACIEHFVATNARYVHAGAPGDGLPYGVTAQIARAGDLRDAHRNATDAADREHVMPWIARRAGVTGYRPPGARGDREAVRATLDTLDDYLRLRAIVRDDEDVVDVAWATLCDRLASAARAPQVARRRGEPLLWLGTAQLGLPAYGIANRVGRPDDASARALLARARDAAAGIDTAHAYGDAEARIGRFVPRDSSVPVVTKLDPLDDVDPGAPPALVRKLVDASVYGSLAALRRNRLDALLLHRYAHRHAWNGAVWTRLCELRDAGWIGRLGASFDRPEDAAEALGDRAIEQWQIPYNVLDRRWDALVRDAAARGRIVHARSVFLQGVIGGDAWPALPGLDAPAWSERVRAATRASGRADERSFAIAYALGEPALAALVVGADTPAQFDENVARVGAPPLTARQRADADALLAGAPPDLLVPSRWP